MPPFRHRHRAALLAAGLIASAPLLAAAPASADPVESGRQVTFTGGGLLGVSCAANPSSHSVTIESETSLRVVNRTGHRATLLLDGAARGEIAKGSTAEVLFHRGPVSLSLKPHCVLAQQKSVRVQVVTPRPADDDPPVTLPDRRPLRRRPGPLPGRPAPTPATPAWAWRHRPATTPVRQGPVWPRRGPAGRPAVPERPAPPRGNRAGRAVRARSRTRRARAASPVPETRRPGARRPAPQGPARRPRPTVCHWTPPVRVTTRLAGACPAMAPGWRRSRWPRWNLSVIRVQPDFSH